MIWRRQLAVASPISGAALARAAIQSARPELQLFDAARRRIERAFGGRTVLMTDSGTSALILALRAAVPPRGIVAFPAYACVDLIAAASFAGVGVRLYDLDPATLSPDLDSVRDTLARGVDAIVVAHLFGYAADVPGVQELAKARGVTVIEDAAQGATGSLARTRLGSMGALAVLSFGRGKGLCAGGGGALLVDAGRMQVIPRNTLTKGGRGLKGLATTAVQWILGRPSVYSLPSALPWLHLGETIYHAAEEPSSISAASASLITSAFALESADVAVRREHAMIIDALVDGSVGLSAVRPIPGSTPGYLRYALRDMSLRRQSSSVAGVVRPYPGTMWDYPESMPIIMEREPPTPGAIELARSLFTLPTHRFVRAKDIASLAEWIKAPH